jgi:four helix bundle protein
MRRGNNQAPNPKHQGSSKLKTTKQPTVRYSNPSRELPVVREESNGHSNGRHPFDLEERTQKFGEAIVKFCKRIPRDPTNDRLIGQLAGCGTSIGGNYCEADERVSKKDFRNVIGRCVKEAKETKYFLRMVAAAEPKLAAEARELFGEARQLHLIFAAIYRKGGE